MEEQLFECDACHRTFVSARSLQSHYRHCKVGTHIPCKGISKSKYKISDNLYKCECGREFVNPQSMNAHFCFCMEHKRSNGLPERVAESKIRKFGKCSLSKECLTEEQFNELHKKAGKSLHNNIVSGKTIPNWRGRHHTEETKQKQRLKMCEWLNSLPVNKKRANYNPNSIPILESIAKEQGWNIQHAENGGEFYTGIGYFVDAYDKERNIVLEYDEPAHYVDVENNVLCEKDIIRQTSIIEHLHCEFWRFNEETKKLWKVENTPLPKDSNDV